MSANGNKGEGLLLFLSGDYMFSSCLREFSAGSPTVSNNVS